MRRKSYLQHTLLAYQRAQEEQADRAGVRFLTMTGQSAKGMYETFKHFADEVMFSSSTTSIRMCRTTRCPRAHGGARGNGKDAVLGQEGSAGAAIPPRHDAGEAVRLHGAAGAVMRHYPATNTSMPARYARAISAYRFGDLRAAIVQIDGLIAAMPNNPYFYELKGQALLEGGHPAEAIAPLRHAVETCAQSRPHSDHCWRRR